MDLAEKWRKYYEDPFSFFDSLNLQLKGRNLNIFAKSRSVARNALYCSLIMLAAWAVFGFDSTPLQFIHALYEGVPAWIMGDATFQDVVGIYNSYYGKEMHYSAFVIYGLMFWGLSVHFDQGLLYWVRSQKRLLLWLNPRYDPAAQPTGLGITKSKNIMFSTGLTLLAIGTFEWFWILSYGYFQGQPWVMSWKWSQARILAQNLIFVSVGGLVAFYMWVDGCILEGRQVIGSKWRFNWNWKACAFIGLTVAAAVFWWFYPWHVDQISVQVQTSAGPVMWTSSRLFPQTLYTIDIDLTDSLNAGVWFWIHNDLIHAVNTIVKIIWTFSIMYICLLKKVPSNEPKTD